MSSFTIALVSLLNIFLLALLSPVYFKIVLFLGNFLPLWYIDHVIGIIYLLFTNFFQIFPLLFLMLAHYVPFGRVIIFCLSDIVYEARIACLLTDVDSPHFEFFTLISLGIIIFFRLFVVLCQNKIFFLWVLYRSPVESFCPFCNELMNGRFPTIINTIAILFYLFFHFWTFGSLRYICCR